MRMSAAAMILCSISGENPTYPTTRPCGRHGVGARARDAVGRGGRPGGGCGAKISCAGRDRADRLRPSAKRSCFGKGGRSMSDLVAGLGVFQKLAVVAVAAAHHDELRAACGGSARRFPGHTGGVMLVGGVSPGCRPSHLFRRSSTARA